jgi:hypothetical protein
VGNFAIERALLINAPAQTIWDELMDVAAWPGWKPFITRAAAPPGGLAPGARFTMNIRVKGPWAVPVPVTVRALDPPREMAWTGGLPGLSTSIHSFILKENAGRTEVVSREEFTGALVGMMLWFVTEKDLARLHDDWLAAIKARVEART